MERIADTVFQLSEIDGGPTMLIDDGELVLVDTGNPGHGDAILAAAEALGHARAALRHILITHADRDHIGSLAAIVAATGARVYAEPSEAAVIEGREADRNGGMVDVPVRVDVLVRGGDVLPLCGGVEVIEAFGHTAGHVAYLTHRDRVLMVGDSLNNNGALTGSRPGFTLDVEQARATVLALARLDPTSVCFGHGPPIVTDGAERIRRLAEAI